jgi:hypothetical protein
MYIGMYLLAAVLANLSSAWFGPIASIFNAFVFIGLDLTARDKLHEAWHNDRLWLKMFLLIASGSVISYIINRNAGMIAVASLAAFGIAGVVDAITYQFLYKKDWMVKVNGSNIFSAAADSLVFPTIAFGGFLPAIVLGQFIAKVTGGFIWSWIISKFKK